MSDSPWAATAEARPVFPDDARALVTALAWLRPCAVIGQALAVVVAVAWLHVVLPLPALACGIGLLAVATPLAFWRLRQPWPVGTAEACCHLAFDMLLLGFVLYFTGGASNPFITLLLAPLALAAVALSGVAMVTMVVLAGTIYALLIVSYVPLADMSMHGNGFRLHLTGMAINFLIAALLLTVFVGRMRVSLNIQREAARRLRERALRDEGILAIATQAADAAHQLNTPLSTLRTLLPELRCGRECDVDLCADLDLMVGEVERCRKILRGMVDYGRQQLAGSTQATTLGRYVHASADRFRLLQPDAAVTVTIAEDVCELPLQVQPGLAHALLSLMQNALDASRRNASLQVTLAATAAAGWVEFAVGDKGNGFPERARVGMPTASSKPDGLGIGLSLARSAIERMRGELQTRADAEGGLVLVRLPLVRVDSP